MDGLISPISATDLKARLDAGEDLVLLDVREPEELPHPVSRSLYSLTVARQLFCDFYPHLLSFCNSTLCVQNVLVLTGKFLIRLEKSLPLLCTLAESGTVRTAHQRTSAQARLLRTKFCREILETALELGHLLAHELLIRTSRASHLDLHLLHQIVALADQTRQLADSCRAVPLICSAHLQYRQLLLN